MSRRKPSVCVWVLWVLGVAVVVTGLVLTPVLNTYIRDKIKGSLPLRNGTQAYSNWLAPPVPVYFQVWVLHVTNPDEVVTEGAVPVLEQRGPYTYREKRQKVGVHYTANDTITYREDVWFHFNRSLSVGPDSDTFTTVNLPMITLTSLLRHQPDLVKKMEQMILDGAGEHLFITLSVHQLLWGYQDSLLKGVKTLLDRFHFNATFDDVFGLFRKQNGSDTGVFRIYTGVHHAERLAYIAQWNGSPSLNFWTSKRANMINGSGDQFISETLAWVGEIDDGTKYPPFVDTSKPQYLFSSQLCRSVEIEHSHSYRLKGIHLARFTIPHTVLEDARHNPDNLGFCTPNTSCVPSGLLNASVCRDGAPLVYSLPHFLDGDPDVLSRVRGLNPNREEHEVAIDMEPMTGMVLHLAKRLQLNAYLHNVSHIRETSKIRKPIYLPILWLNETAHVDDKSAKEFRDQVQQPLLLAKTVKIGLPSLGCFLLAIGTCLYMLPHARRKWSSSISESTPFLRNRNKDNIPRYEGPIY